MKCLYLSIISLGLAAILWVAPWASWMGWTPLYVVWTLVGLGAFLLFCAMAAGVIHFVEWMERRMWP